MKITHEQVRDALDTYRAQSIEQALHRTFGEAAYEDANLALRHIKNTVTEYDMRLILEKVAAARKARAEKNAASKVAAKAAALYRERSGRVTDYSPRELDAWNAVVELVLSEAQVSLRGASS